MRFELKTDWHSYNKDERYSYIGLVAENKLDREIKDMWPHRDYISDENAHKVRLLGQISWQEFYHYTEQKIMCMPTPVAPCSLDNAGTWYRVYVRSKLLQRVYAGYRRATNEEIYLYWLGRLYGNYQYTKAMKRDEYFAYVKSEIRKSKIDMIEKLLG